jgi:hypothetical protein
MGIVDSMAVVAAASCSLGHFSTCILSLAEYGMDQKTQDTHQLRSFEAALRGPHTRTALLKVIDACIATPLVFTATEDK